MASLFPRLRGNGTHRADDRIAELTQSYEQKLADLREENVLLHKRLASADDYFMQLDQALKELEEENSQIKEMTAGEREARTAIEKDRDALDRYLHDVESRLADAERRLEVCKLAETAVERTQEMPVITPVVPLQESPQAKVARTPSWAQEDAS